MNKLTVVLLAALVSTCMIVPAFGKNYIKLGYKVEDSNTKNLNAHQKWSWEPEDKDFQFETETNIYKFCK